MEVIENDTIFIATDWHSTQHNNLVPKKKKKKNKRKRDKAKMEKEKPSNKEGLILLSIEVMWKKSNKIN